jgi:8-oxo-dGTP pyrophosphatase MutT (NUDIX family)
LAEPPWGFPKGKKLDAKMETDIQCALREFSEETKISTDDFYIWDTKPHSEFFKGSNGKNYCTHYYLFECESELPIKKIETPQCIRTHAVSEEAAEVGWFDIDDACKRLVPRRQAILKKIDQMIRTQYTDYSPLAQKSEPV